MLHLNVFGHLPKTFSGIMMKQKKNLILTGFPKITFVFSAIVTVVFLNTAFNYYLIQRENENLEKITESINPYVDELDELCDILIESKIL